jgi:hypothetical protein
MYATEQAILNAQYNTEVMRQAPSVLYRPRISLDGNQWCALYGDNLQDGVAGFGDSPQAAMYEFDKAWATSLGS